MKAIRILVGSTRLLLLILPMADALAETHWQLLDKTEHESGFSGYIQLLVGGYSGKGLNSVADKNRQIESLEADAQDYQEEFLTASWELAYGFKDTNTSLFFAKPDIGGAEFTIPFQLGIRHHLSDSTVLSAAYVPKLSDSHSEVWQDPYLTNQDRQRTGLEFEVLSFSAEYILGSPFSVLYDYGEQSVENDLSGESLASELTSEAIKKLQRDMTFNRFQLSLTFPLADKFYIIPELKYVNAKAEGEANNYATTGLDVSLFLQFKDFELFGSVYFHTTDFPERNPVFKAKRQDDRYGAAAGISYLLPFDWGTTKLDFIISSSYQDSNIHFYDNRDELAMVGLTYQF
jgi:hypothetical protein